jgi:hypothetical protein
MPLWSEGVSTDRRTQLLRIESLITESGRGSNSAEMFFESFGKHRIKAEIVVRPLGKSYSIVLAVAADSKRKTWFQKSTTDRRAQSGPHQLNPFG